MLLEESPVKTEGRCSVQLHLLRTGLSHAAPLSDYRSLPEHKHDRSI